MNTFKAFIRNGRVEPDAPLNLPEGTELLILPTAEREETGADWDDTPEGIAAWLKSYDALQPMLFTAEEREALIKDQAARKEWESAQDEQRNKRLRDLWE